MFPINALYESKLFPTNVEIGKHFYHDDISYSFKCLCVINEAKMCTSNKRPAIVLSKRTACVFHLPSTNPVLLSTIYSRSAFDCLSHSSLNCLSPSVFPLLPTFSRGSPSFFQLLIQVLLSTVGFRSTFSCRFCSSFPCWSPS